NSEAIRKTLSKTGASTTLHRLRRCPSPAADAYFTDTAPRTQAFFAESLRSNIEAKRMPSSS
ncbi:hypothetical protein, partial [Halomonas caseinilytica]|uniref:hypothetical protein n=1 Tax=Halomonas caseinilytica TaxID=438744 RepID=UPI001B8AE062